MAKFMKQDGMQTRIETNLDMSDMTITIPTRKLDADLYPVSTSWTDSASLLR